MCNNMLNIRPILAIPTSNFILCPCSIISSTISVSVILVSNWKLCVFLKKFNSNIKNLISTYLFYIITRYEFNHTQWLNMWWIILCDQIDLKRYFQETEHHPRETIFFVIIQLPPFHEITIKSMYVCRIKVYKYSLL